MADLVGTKVYYRYGTYVKYSHQQLLDCTWYKYPNGLNKGCRQSQTHLNSQYAVSNGLIF